jgi:RsiW-degrading membrane proteinase PrsW (M82 family)
MQRFVVDVCAQLWTMAILMLATNRVRTIGWRACAGAALTGFLALTGLARFVGRPLIEHFGESNVFAIAVWVPLTEEFLKMLPVLLVLLLALRRSDSRPAAVDAMLLGGWTGAGFAACESATLGRGGFSLFAHPTTTLIFPSQNAGAAFGWTVVQSGHMIHTALIAVAVALSAFYGHRIRRNWVVPVVAIAAVLLEHCSQNAMVANGLHEFVAKAAIALTLGGRLSAVLLIAAAAFTVVFESRIVKGSAPGAIWAPLQPAEAARRAALLARAQARRTP